MLNKKTKRKDAGFTILEVIVAIFVLTVAVGGSFVLIQQTLIAASLTQSKLTAAYLAQEGIEIVRNIRDTNWLKIHNGISGISWTDGLVYVFCEPSQQGCQVDYNDQTLTVYEGNSLNLENGFYSHSPGGLPTPFKRQIFVSSIGPDALEVSVNVYWSERGREHSIEVVEHLYNWKP